MSDVLVSPLIPDSAHSVNTTLTYSKVSPLVPLTEKWFVDMSTSKRNFDPDTIPATVYDIRGQEAVTHINTTGFQAITSPTSVDGDLILNGSEADVARVYYPEVEALLLKATGASRVVFFDHTIRMARPPGTPQGPTTRAPVLRAHADQTPISAHTRVQRHVQPPKPYKRFQIINVWRPISNTVYEYPLAVMDSHTLDVVNDLVPTNMIYAPPVPTGETYNIKHNNKHVWWYWSEMTPNDVLLLKCYDSASRAMIHVKESAHEVQESELRDVAAMTPHTAFVDEEGAKKGIKRQSIEVRALVFYD